MKTNTETASHQNDDAGATIELCRVEAHSRESEGVVVATDPSSPQPSTPLLVPRVTDFAPTATVNTNSSAQIIFATPAGAISFPLAEAVGSRLPLELVESCLSFKNNHDQHPSRSEFNSINESQDNQCLNTAETHPSTSAYFLAACPQNFKTIDIPENEMNLVCKEASACLINQLPCCSSLAEENFVCPDEVKPLENPGHESTINPLGVQELSKPIMLLSPLAQQFSSNLEWAAESLSEIGLQTTLNDVPLDQTELGIDVPQIALSNCTNNVLETFQGDHVCQSDSLEESDENLVSHTESNSICLKNGNSEIFDPSVVGDDGGKSADIGCYAEIKETAHTELYPDSVVWNIAFGTIIEELTAPFIQCNNEEQPAIYDYKAVQIVADVKPEYSDANTKLNTFATSMELTENASSLTLGELNVETIGDLGTDLFKLKSVEDCTLEEAIEAPNIINHSVAIVSLDEATLREMLPSENLTVEVLETTLSYTDATTKSPKPAPNNAVYEASVYPAEPSEVFVSSTDSNITYSNASNKRFEAAVINDTEFSTLDSSHVDAKEMSLEYHGEKIVRVSHQSNFCVSELMADFTAEECSYGEDKNPAVARRETVLTEEVRYDDTQVISTDFLLHENRLESDNHNEVRGSSNSTTTGTEGVTTNELVLNSSDTFTKNGEQSSATSPDVVSPRINSNQMEEPDFLDLVTDSESQDQGANERTTFVTFTCAPTPSNATLEPVFVSEPVLAGVEGFVTKARDEVMNDGDENTDIDKNMGMENIQVPNDGDGAVESISLKRNNTVVVSVGSCLECYEPLPQDLSIAADFSQVNCPPFLAVFPYNLATTSDTSDENDTLKVCMKFLESAAANEENDNEGKNSRVSSLDSNSAVISRFEGEAGSEPAIVNSPGIGRVDDLLQEEAARIKTCTGYFIDSDLDQTCMANVIVADIVNQNVTEEICIEENNSKSNSTFDCQNTVESHINDARITQKSQDNCIPRSSGNVEESEGIFEINNVDIDDLENEMSPNQNFSPGLMLLPESNFGEVSGRKPVPSANTTKEFGVIKNLLIPSDYIVSVVSNKSQIANTDIPASIRTVFKKPFKTPFKSPSQLKPIGPPLRQSVSLQPHNTLPPVSPAPSPIISSPTVRKFRFKPPSQVPKFSEAKLTFPAGQGPLLHLLSNASAVMSSSHNYPPLDPSAFDLTPAMFQRLIQSDVSLQHLVYTRLELERTLKILTDDQETITKAERLTENNEGDHIKELLIKWQAACRTGIVEMRDLVGVRLFDFSNNKGEGNDQNGLSQGYGRLVGVRKRQHHGDSGIPKKKKAKMEKPIAKINDDEEEDDDEDEDGAGWCAFVKGLGGEVMESSEPNDHDDDDGTSDDDNNDEEEIDEVEVNEDESASASTVQNSYREGEMWSLKDLAMKIGIDLVRLGGYDGENDCFFE
ncbi:hypothetical protein BCR33DRAFT_845999 [Rhizoclosmatium globosum]|uniref:Uncharacterized protein n=1 Tax=Rhizoclosmatium globosum TaxID=329046 RepID=A0A1Y2CYC5_9FUNG|nr:hypothetical protein BCR33DRAFT_845999 [Rhizoclosmatium globosum]|eukprot:ORY52020.1 hypothetical protein BCR33DRAFT_845999 [Rhizoclosmatium globosum]